MNTAIEVNGKTISIESVWTNEKKSSWGAHENQHHTILVTHEDTTVSFDYWASQAKPSIECEQDLHDAFNCFLLDAMSGDNTHNGFCDELGYEMYNDEGEIDTDTLDVYNSCVKMNNKFNSLNIGDIYDCSNDFSEKYDV